MQRKSVPDTSASLLIRIRNPEDKESWKTFERIYGGIIQSYCRHWKLQPNDADDIVQEVLSAVAKQIQNFEYDPAKGRFRAWLGTITANRIKRLLSQKQNRREAELPLPSDNENHAKVYEDPDSEWVNLFSEQILREACQNVRPQVEETTWKSFESVWIDQMSAPEVAKSLDIPVHSVYVNKSRVLKRLEQEIKILADDVACDFG